MRVDGFLLTVALTNTDETMKVITPVEELSAVAAHDKPDVTVPPEAFFDQVVADEDREAARCFYRKYIEVFGMPVVAADEVVDEALFRTRIEETTDRQYDITPDGQRFILNESSISLDEPIVVTTDWRRLLSESRP